MDIVSKEEFDRLLTVMVQSAEGVSDLLFVASKGPQMQVHGRIAPFASSQSVLTSASIERLANFIINNNPTLLQELARDGSCDCSYTLPNCHRFRVNIYRQNGNFAMVLRCLMSKIPAMDSLQLPAVVREMIAENNGIIFVTGGTGNGKTTTLAAILNEINLTREVHIVTLEDPIEFLHTPVKAIFSQRELGRDFFDFAGGMRAAMRQAPKVIMVGEIRDRETMEVALAASETGHIVFSTMQTNSAGQTINRILGIFHKDEEQQVRQRLAVSLRYIISQRLVPKVNGGRLLVTELMGSNLRTREAILLGENENRRFAEMIEAGRIAGWHSFEQSLLKAYEDKLITAETALLYSSNKSVMKQRVDGVDSQRQAASIRSMLKMEKENEKESEVPNAEPTDETRDVLVREARTVSPGMAGPSHSQHD